MKLSAVAVFFVCLFWISHQAHTQETPGAIALDKAKTYFSEADRLCHLDNGKLWGISTCGPILFVDRTTREVVANQKDEDGVLTPEAGVWVGRLPNSENIANTATMWSGTYWSEMLWPPPEDLSRRDTLMEHELYHRLQKRLGLETGMTDNAHLDSVQGRYLIQLEERALAAALTASDEAARRQAVQDALLFRSRRYALFSKARQDEKALELNEGLAEYTGVRLGNPAREAETRQALDDLDRQQKASTFVRSFAYATGPAYGLLLDEYAPGWRSRLTTQTGLDEVLAHAAGWTAAPDGPLRVEQRAAVYGGPALLNAEQQRDLVRQATIRHYRSTLVEGPMLTLAFQHMQVQFNPQNLQPLGDAGTVYPTIRITDAWGVLEATHGALVKPDWSAVVVACPEHSSGELLTGDGWTLHLTAGWKVVPGERKGDLVLQSPSKAATP